MKQRRILSFLLTLALIFTVLPNHAFAECASADQSTLHENKLYSIIDNYHTQKFLLSNNILSRNATAEKPSLTTETAVLLRNTISDLRNAGYEAFVVTEQNHSDIGNKLSTDFSELDFDGGLSYIAVVHGDEAPSQKGDLSSREYTSAQFTYTYNGTTYTMRYLTLFADYTGAARTTTVDMLEPSWASPLNNFLNSSISAIISMYSAPLGFIYSMAGIDLTEVISQTESSLTLHAGVNWTRTYTQIYDSSEGSWLYGSMVEYAKATSYFSGLIYYESTNSMAPVDDSLVERTLYSEHYSDFEWRKEGAVLGIYYGGDYHRDDGGRG